MTINNWSEAKEKIKVGIPVFLIMAGFIILIVSMLSLWNSLVGYQEQLKQVDWPITNATVSYVETKVERPHKHRSTYYDIYYEYVIEDQVYTGIIEDQNRRKNIGDSFEIKYNPSEPAESTRILEPTKSYILNSSIFAAAGLTLMIFNIFLLKKWRRSN